MKETIQLSRLEYQVICENAKKLGVAPPDYLTHCVALVMHLNLTYADHNGNIVVKSPVDEILRQVNILP